MDAELKLKWLAELAVRPKTTGVLQNNQGQCCLGVLADVCGINKEQRGDGSYNFYFPDYVNPANAGIPLPYLRRLKIDPGQQQDLMQINDSTPTFKEVIAYIEENL